MDPTESPEPKAEVTPPAPAMTLGQRLSAAGDALLARGTPAEAAALRSQVQALTAERDALQGQVATLTRERDVAIAAAAVAEGRVAAAERAVADFEGRVRSATIDACASASIPESQLPRSANASGSEESIDSLRKRLNATKDPEERGKLVAAIRRFSQPATDSN